jgi:hypothetical protein
MTGSPKPPLKPTAQIPPNDEGEELTREAGTLFPSGPIRDFIVELLRAGPELADSPAIRVFLQFVRSTSPKSLKRLKSPEFQRAFAERLASWAEVAPADELVLLGEDILGVKMTRSEGRAFATKEVRVNLARSIRDEAAQNLQAQSVVGSSSRSPPLAPDDFARLRRSMRLGGPLIEEAIEFAKRGEQGKAGVAALKAALGAAPLMVAPPPHNARYGRGARAPYLLPSDRKHCGVRGCGKAVANRSKFCPTHARLFRTERDRIKKLRRRDAKRVLRFAHKAESARIR